MAALGSLGCRASSPQQQQPAASQAAAAQREEPRHDAPTQDSSSRRRWLLSSLACVTAMPTLAALPLAPAAGAADSALSGAPPRASSSKDPLSPEAQASLRAVLAKFVTKEKAPVLLRLAFHDAGTYSAKVGPAVAACVGRSLWGSVWRALVGG